MKTSFMQGGGDGQHQGACVALKVTRTAQPTKVKPKPEAKAAPKAKAKK
jgi:hypothetical protein